MSDTANSTAVDPKLLEILVCPVTKGPLIYDREAGELISRAAGLAYPVRDGIPIMLAGRSARFRMTGLAKPLEIRVRRASRRLEVDFEGGVQFSYSAEYLRVESPSAEVQGHAPSERITVPGKAGVGINTVDPDRPLRHPRPFRRRARYWHLHLGYLLQLGQEQEVRWSRYLGELAAKGLSREAPPARSARR